MKKFLTMILAVVLLTFSVSMAMADTTAAPVINTPVVASAAPATATVSDPPVILQTGGFTVTSPMETSVTAFYLPDDGAIAPGIAQTVLRAQHSAIPRLTLDIDFCAAQEVNEQQHTLGGIGTKLGYKTTMTSKTGVTFEPSLGAALLNDFSRYKTMRDIATHYRFAFYGSAVLYRWW